MIEITRILVPIDFSDYSRHALAHAVAVARGYDSTITLLHVCSVVPVAAYAPGTPILPSVALTPADRDELLRAKSATPSKRADVGDRHAYKLAGPPMAA